MRTPSTTDLSFTLCDDWIGPAKTESQVPPFLFQNLLPELQTLISGQFDMPTRCSFTWTCQLYYADGAEEFDCFAFADQCAELGHRVLLEYSIERGGPFDFETSNVAAAHGHVGVLQLFVRHWCQNNLVYNPEKMNLYFTDWAVAAARTGRHGVLDWLKFAKWRNAEELGRVAFAALDGAQHIAVEILQRINAFSSTSGQQWGVTLLRKAYEVGQIEVVKHIWEMGCRLDPFSGPSVPYVHPTVVAWYLDNNPFGVDVSSQLPALLKMGKNYGIVALLRLAVEHGATTSLNDFDPRFNHDYLPKTEVLRYLHERFGLDSAPFKGKYTLPSGNSKADLQWMREQGYQLDSWLLSHHYLRDVELLPGLFQLGFRPTFRDIREAASNCRLDLLDIFFQKAKEKDRSDNDLIALFLKNKSDKVRADRFRLKMILKTLKWLVDHQYPFGQDTSACDYFVCALLDHQPRLFRNSFEQISAFNMPLSPETSKRITDFMAKKQ